MTAATALSWAELVVLMDVPETSGPVEQRRILGEWRDESVAQLRAIREADVRVGPSASSVRLRAATLQEIAWIDAYLGASA